MVIKASYKSSMLNCQYSQQHYWADPERDLRSQQFVSNQRHDTEVNRSNKTSNGNTSMVSYYIVPSTLYNQRNAYQSFYTFNSCAVAKSYVGVVCSCCCSDFYFLDSGNFLSKYFQVGWSIGFQFFQKLKKF